MQYKRKEYLTEAIKWDGTNKKEIIDFIGPYYRASTPEVIFMYTDKKKVEAVLIGRYIVKGKKYFRIMKEEEFNKKFEEVI